MRPADRGTERPWVPASQMLLGYPSGISERCNLDSIMMPGPLEAEGCGHALSRHWEPMSMPKSVVAGLGFGLNKSATCSGHCPRMSKPRGHPYPLCQDSATDRSGCQMLGALGSGAPRLRLDPKPEARWPLRRPEASCPQHLPRPCLLLISILREDLQAP